MNAQRRSTTTILALLGMLTLIPAGAVAQTSNDIYRLCLDDATADRLIAESQASEEYFEEIIDAHRAYQQDIEASKDLDDHDARQRAIKEAKKEFRDRDRAAKEDRSEKLRNIRDEQRRAKEECKNEHDQRRDDENNNNDNDDNNGRREVGECKSDGDCPSGRICSTRRGDCLPACADPNDVCIQVCTGHCIRP